MDAYEVGKFYWVWIVLDPDVQHEWENDTMPARFAGYSEAGEELWNFLNPDTTEWPVRWSSAIAPPVAAGSVDSIDTNEFCDLMTELQDVHERIVNCKPNWDALIAHIHAWGAQQRHEGFQEGIAQLQQERDNLLKLAASRREWAEKAEADLAQVNEWRAAALAESQTLGELWAAKVDKAEARVAELQEALDVAMLVVSLHA